MPSPVLGRNRIGFIEKKKQKAGGGKEEGDGERQGNDKLCEGRETQREGLQRKQ